MEVHGGLCRDTRGHTTLASPCQATRESWPHSTPAANSAKTRAFPQLVSQLHQRRGRSPGWASDGVTTSQEREQQSWRRKAPLCSISFFSRIRAWLAGGKFHTLMKQKGARKEGRERAQVQLPAFFFLCPGGSSDFQKSPLNLSVFPCGTGRNQIYEHFDRHFLHQGMRSTGVGRGILFGKWTVAWKVTEDLWESRSLFNC